MLNRIFIIAFLTGIGQILSVFVIKSFPYFFSDSEIASIAQIDALIFFMVNVIALGLQSSAMRNIAVSKDWKSEFQQTQSARLSLSFILFSFGLLFFFKWEYSIFFLAPLFAYSGDYALYARGKPVKGALFACIRLIVPYILILIAGYLYPNLAIYIFITGWILVYTVTNHLIIKTLKASTSIKFYWIDLKLYVQSLQLGIVSLAFYFLGTGLILITPFFYSPFVQAAVFIGLKLYMVFKGILRIIHQAFFKEMIYDEWCLKIDKFSILIALLYSGSFVFFPKSFITFFFGKQYLSEESFFWFLAIASLVYSFVLSSATRALLDKMDTKYSVVCLIAASTAILSTMALSFFKPDALNIGISVLLGEIIFCVGLIKISKIKELFKTRVAFFISNSLLLIIPLFSRIFFHDILKYFILSVIIFGIALLSKNYKIFLD
jgi:hypothetical protein